MCSGTNNSLRRILLKISGEALGGDASTGIDKTVLDGICKQIAAVTEQQLQLAIVIGGGNFFRGINAAETGLDKLTADYIGMLATVMNALALRSKLRGEGIEAKVQSAIPMSPIAETYDRDKAVEYLENGWVVIFAAGTGNPFFTTDTAAGLRAIEIGAELLLKATMVDGVYSDDPKRNANAVRYERISYDEVLEKRLAVMDATAVALCRDYGLRLKVFTMDDEGSLMRAINDDTEGTIIYSEA